MTPRSPLAIAPFALAALIVATAPALAQTLTGKEAKKALFAPVTAEVEILPEAGLPEDQAAALVLVGQGQPYYGAIAISPDEGLMSEATVAAANYHDTASAGKAALADCNARKTGKSDCVLAALIRPKGWKDRGFTLSSDATAAIKSYPGKGGALALSASTGSWGMGKGEGAGDAALAECQGRNTAAKDCALAVAD